MDTVIVRAMIMVYPLYGIRRGRLLLATGIRFFTVVRGNQCDTLRAVEMCPEGGPKRPGSGSASVPPETTLVG